MRLKNTLILLTTANLLIISCNTNSSENEDKIPKQTTPPATNNVEETTDTTSVMMEYARQKQDEQKAEADTKAAEMAAQKLWDNSKAGKIKKKHPNWSEYDCERIAENEIWIGMTIDMLKYERGKPNSSNPSDYGQGREWQWCWHDQEPSCFYGEDDGIITSYN